ncbi:MAG: hypothetical protein KDE53_04435 [Caldilineaceae bacterium]|nr:hypothetical protein [Caldilineaceae bacterium]
MKTDKPTLLFYCQHVLGMGHLMRSRALVEGFLGDFQITFLNGGELIPGFEFPAAVEVINLPPLKADAAFTTIEGTSGKSVSAIKAERAQLLLDTYARLQPDLLVIELFPFGRKKFAFELMPLLAQIRRNAALGLGKPTKVVCSLRDIMVSRRDQWKHEARACRILNRYFDLLLIHADPTFQRLEESFGQVDALVTPGVYTGYVAQEAAADMAGTGAASDEPRSAEPQIPLTGQPLIVASIGGGRVGSELLRGAVAASIQLKEHLPHQLLIFTGPYIPNDEFFALEEMVAGQEQITLRRYTSRFLHYLAQANLSLSMAGYNTSMNVLTTGVRALMLPFTGGDNDEQRVRTDKLAAIGAVGALTPADLAPATLAQRIVEQLAAPHHPIKLDLDGVAKSAAALRQLVAPTASSAHTVITPHAPTLLRSVAVPGAALLESELRPFLEHWQAQPDTVGMATHLFLRDDDIDEDEETLRELLDVALARGVPINLEVIPGTLTDACARLIADHKRFTPDLVQLDQHGWLHSNHEREGRKCEFGPSRGYHQQYEDIARGKELLASTLPDLISPVFTPPWNRCTEDTYRVLDELGFAVFSGLRGKTPVTGYRFQEISVTLDLYHWKGGAVMKEPALIIADLIAQIQARAPIGLLLHHKVMERTAFAFLDRLLAMVRAYPFVHCHTFDTMPVRLPQPMVESERIVS